MKYKIRIIQTPISESHEKDFENALPEYVKEGITRSKKQANAGMLMPYDEVMKKYAKYLRA
jgi:hypothetical protein